MADDSIVRMATTIAALDPRQYEQGVAKVEAAAARAAAANARLEESTDRVGRQTVTSASAIDRLIAANDKLFAAEQKRERQIRQVESALQAGTIDQDKYARALAAIEQGYANQIRLADRSSQLVAANSNAVRGNVAATTDATRAGADLTRTATLQARAHQAVTDALEHARGPMEEYAAHGGTISALLRQLGPVGLAAAAAFGAFSLVVAKGVEVFTETEQVQTRLNATLRATGFQSGVTGQQIEDMAQRLSRSAAVSQNDVRQAATVLATYGQASRLGFERILSLSADVAAVFGRDLPGTTERLAQELQKLATGSTQTLGEAFGFLSASARQAIEQLAQTGRGGEAAARALEEARRQIGGAGASEANTISGALRQSVSATGDLLAAIARVTGATDRARDSALGWASAMRLIRDALAPDQQTRQQRQEQSLASDIATIQARVDQRRREIRIDEPGRSAASRRRLENILSADSDYQADVRRLQQLRGTETAAAVDEAFARSTSDARIAASAGGAARIAEERDQAARDAQTARELQRLNQERQRAIELARMAPDVRARQQAADQAETEVLRVLTRAQQASLTELRAMPAAQTDAAQAQIRSARAGAEQRVALEQSSQATQQLTQRQQQARDAIDRQVAGLDEQARALGVSDRERAIATQVIQAQNTAQQANITLTETEIRRVREAAGALYDQTQRRQNATRAMEEQARAINRTVDRVVDFGADAIDRMLSGANGSFKELWDNFVSLARKAFAQAVAEAAIRPIVTPIVMQVVGSLGGMFGVGTGGGQVTVVQTPNGPSLALNGQPIGVSQGGGVQLPNLPIGSLLGNGGGSLGSIGSWLSGTGNWLNNGIGTSLGFNPGFSPQELQFLNSQGITGLGASGTFTSFLGDAIPIIGSALPGIISGNYAQAGFGAGGAAIGLAVGGPIGATIGGFLGNLVGGLFGRKSPPFNTSSQLYSISGGLLENNGGTGKGEFTAGAGSLGSAYFQALQRLQQAAGGSIVGGPDMRFAMAGTDGQNPFYRALPNDAWYWGRGWADVDSPEAALRIGLQQSIGRLQWSGVGRAAQYVLANEGGGDFDALLGRLQQAVDFQKRYDAAIGDTGETLSQVQQQIKALNDQFDAMTKEAASYGFAASELDAARARALAKMRDSYDENVQQMILAITDPQGAALQALDKERQQAIEDATALGANINEVERLYGLRREAIVKQGLQNLDTQLRAWLDAQIFGAASSSSPVTRLDAAQAQFGAQLGLARGGDVTAAQGLTGYADRLLAAAREYYASGEGFVAIEQWTRSQIQEIGKALGLPGFASGGSFLVGGAGGTDSQVVAFRATPNERVTVETPAQQGALQSQIASLGAAIARLEKSLRDSNHLRVIGR